MIFSTYFLKIPFLDFRDISAKSDYHGAREGGSITLYILYIYEHLFTNNIISSSC